MEELSAIQKKNFKGFVVGTDSKDAHWKFCWKIELIQVSPIMYLLPKHETTARVINFIHISILKNPETRTKSLTVIISCCTRKELEYFVIRLLHYV